MTREELNRLVTIEDLEKLYQRIKTELLSLINKDKKEFYTPKEFARKTGLPYTTIIHYCNTGKLKARQATAGGAWLIHRTEIDRFIEDAEQNKIS